MARKFKNNASSTLASSLASADTTLYLATGTGVRFPTLTGADTFLMTLQDATNVEIVSVTARATDTLTIVRAQEGTTSPATFASGTVASLRLTAGVIEDIVNHAADTADAHAASAITNTPAGNLAATTVQAALDELQNDVDTRATAAALTAHTGDSTAAHAASAISYAGSTGLAATDVEGALDELDIDKEAAGTAAAAVAAHTGDSTAAHAASAISYAGSTGLAATDVEGALDELDSEKASATALSDHLNDTSAAHAASAISYAGGAGLAATDVEAAIDELAGGMGGMTLLGTLTTTSGTTQTLSGLTLTDYKMLLCSVEKVSAGTTGKQLVLDGQAISMQAFDPSTADTLSGLVWIELATGIATAAIVSNDSGGALYAADTSYSTASTSIVFSMQTATFDAGQIRVWGIK